MSNEYNNYDPQYQSTQPPYGQQPVEGESMATAGQICGILSIFFACVGLVLPILGIIFSSIALSQLPRGHQARSRQRQG